MDPINPNKHPKRANDTPVLENLRLAQKASASSQTPIAKRIRAELRRKIIKLLIQSRRVENPSCSIATTDICRALIDMAQNLENNLFHKAETWDEYHDESTLAKRCSFVVAQDCQRQQTLWKGRNTNTDQRLRDEITSIIHRMYTQRLPPGTTQAYKDTHVPLIAQAIERAFYREAKTRREYADKSVKLSPILMVSVPGSQELQGTFDTKRMIWDALHGCDGRTLIITELTMQLDVADGRGDMMRRGSRNVVWKIG
eukprot:scaffold3784_cov174-Amphora_coffeaeformis.AAC.1